MLNQPTHTQRLRSGGNYWSGKAVEERKGGMHHWEEEEENGRSAEGVKEGPGAAPRWHRRVWYLLTAGQGCYREGELRSSTGASELLAPLHMQAICLLLFLRECPGFARAAAAGVLVRGSLSLCQGPDSTWWPGRIGSVLVLAMAAASLHPSSQRRGRAR